MKSLPEIQSAISHLSSKEMRQLLAWMDNHDEAHLELSDAFKGRIESSELQMAKGQRPRTR